MKIRLISTATAAIMFGVTLPASAQVHPLGEGLGKLDKDRDGKIGPAEWSADKPGLFRKIDADKNGELAAVEVSAFYLKVAPAEDPKTRQRIDGVMKADANADGKVSLAEMLAESDADFKKRDIDGDGFVTVRDKR